MKILEHVMQAVNSWTVEMMDAVTCSHFHCMLARERKYEKEIPTLNKQYIAVWR